MTSHFVLALLRTYRRPKPVRLLESPRKHIVTIEMPIDNFLSVSPDGQFLFNTRLDCRINELMLVENFP